jgi:hypothetical protein
MALLTSVNDLIILPATFFLLDTITVAARSKAWTVFARSNTVIVGSNPTEGIDVYVRRGWSPFQGVLLVVYRIKKVKRRLESNNGPVESKIDR